MKKILIPTDPFWIRNETIVSVSPETSSRTDGYKILIGGKPSETNTDF